MNALTSARDTRCSLGRICMVSTPEGKRCGLSGRRPWGSGEPRQSASVEAILGCVSHLMISCSGAGGDQSRRVYGGVDFRIFVGLTDLPVALTKEIRGSRGGSIPRDVGISLHGDGTEVGG